MGKAGTGIPSVMYSEAACAGGSRTSSGGPVGCSAISLGGSTPANTLLFSIRSVQFQMGSFIVIIKFNVLSLQIWGDLSLIRRLLFECGGFYQILG